MIHKFGHIEYITCNAEKWTLTTRNKSNIKKNGYENSERRKKEQN
jgi:hypothetical protein